MSHSPKRSVDYNSEFRETPPIRATDPFVNQDLKRLKLWVYLIPVMGCFPALWTLVQDRGDRADRNASRISLMLLLTWLGSDAVLAVGAKAVDSFDLPFLLASSLLTSSYFLISFWLMIRVWQRKALRLPHLSR